MSNTLEKTILVPFGSTTEAMISIKQSYRLAELTNSRLMLLGVENIRHPFDQKVFDSTVEEVKKMGSVKVETMVRRGNIFEELTKVADILEPIFIVIRIKEKISPDKLIGRNAFKMVRQSKHAVLTFRKGEAVGDFKTIVLPLDLSKESREKVNKAIELAKMFNAQIKIVSVSNSRSEEKKLTLYMKQVEKIITEFDVQNSSEIIHGKHIPTAVITYAQGVKADLIVIMSQQKLHLSEMTLWNMGTNAQQLINESDIPVLSIRPMRRKDTTSSVTPY